MKSNFGVRGRYAATVANAEKGERQLHDILALLSRSTMVRDDADRYEQHIRLKMALASFHEAAEARTMEAVNIIPDAGLSVIAQRIGGTTTYTGIPNYVALGTSTTAPAGSDTTLGTEGYRAAPSSQTYSGNVAYVSLFIPAATATGTWTEAGLFIDGTGSADTGQLLSHVLLDPAQEKTSTDTLTIEAEITVA